MPRDLPAYVEKNRVGRRVYLSFRRGKGPRIRLPDDPSTDEFKVAYAAALAGEVRARPAKRASVVPGTIDALIVSYLRSPGYVELRDTTKKGYASRIETIRTKHGHRPIAGLTADRIEKAFLQPYAGKPGARLSILKMLRVLIRHAIRTGKLRHDPSLGIKRPKTKEVRAWTEAEIATFEAKWPIGTKARLAFALQLYTGQRRSDVHRMTWPDVAGGRVSVIQQKTGMKVDILQHPELARVLAATERKHVTILNTELGRPFTVNGYGNWLRDAITEAGLPLDAKPHGLRKAAGKRLADVGASAHTIMAVLGHVTLAEAERYTREADRVRLGDAGIISLAGQTANRFAQTTPRDFGKIPKSEGE